MLSLHVFFPETFQNFFQDAWNTTHSSVSIWKHVNFFSKILKLSLIYISDRNKEVIDLKLIVILPPVCLWQLRTHLGHIHKHQHQTTAINLNNPESQGMHLETRLEQLDSAIKMELWQVKSTHQMGWELTDWKYFKILYLKKKSCLGVLGTCLVIYSRKFYYAANNFYSW